MEERSAGRPTDQLEGDIRRSQRLRFLLHLPEGFGAKSGGTWPMILYLHGAGERGDDLDLVKLHGIARVVETRPDLPFVAVSPQCPEGTWWWDHHLILRALVEEVVSRYDVDRCRVYLTGNSMGGYGTWSLGAAFPHLFAALAPICGGGVPELAPFLEDLPVWAFHGDADDIVSPEVTRRMVEALEAVGGNIRFTLYPGGQHDSWTRTYEDPELYAWFLRHRREARE